jgi:hypothetical protein
MTSILGTSLQGHGTFQATIAPQGSGNLAAESLDTSTTDQHGLFYIISIRDYLYNEPLHDLHHPTLLILGACIEAQICSINGD